MEVVGDPSKAVGGVWSTLGAIRGELRVLAMVRQTLLRSHLGRACERFGRYIRVKRTSMWLWVGAIVVRWARVVEVRVLV